MTFPLGIGWSGSYLQRIQYTGTDLSGRTGAYVYRPDGSLLFFAESGGAFACGCEVSDTLAWAFDGFGNKTGWLYTTVGSDQELYNLSGQLQSVTHGGAAQTLTYSANGYLASVSDAFGHTLTFNWDASTQRRITSIVDPAGGTTSFTYDTKNNLASVTYPDTRQVTYLYELTGSTQVNLMTGRTDENATRYATWGYTSSLVTSSQLAGSADSYSFTYNSNGSRVVVDPLGTSRTYTTAFVGGQRRYTGVNSLCSGCGESSAVSYDTNGNSASRTDFNGNLTCYGYDLSRNLETVRVEGFAAGSTCPANLAAYTPVAGTRQRKIITAWATAFSLPSQIVESNRTTSFSYDANGNLLTKTITDTSVTPNLSRTWTYTYDSYGRMLTAKGPRTDVDTTTTYTYYTCTTSYQCGQLQTITDAVGNVTTYNSYNAHGQPLTITDPNGVVTTLTYDARQHLTSRQVGSEMTTFSYWPTGLLKQVTLPDSSYLFCTYDNAHRLTQIGDGLGNKIVYTLDAMGNRTAENTYDPSAVLHRTHTRVINALNQLYQDVNAAGTAAVTTTFGYDNNGNQTAINAPLSRNTTNQYDELNRLKRITDPGNGYTYFSYDANDNLTSVQDPRGLTTSYSYDGFADVTQQVSPDTGTTTDAYDSGGNLATSTDARGAVASYTYDALNRVTSVG